MGEVGGESEMGMGSERDEPVPDDFLPAFCLDVFLDREGRAACGEQLGERVQFRSLVLCRCGRVREKAEFRILGLHVLYHARRGLRRPDPGHAADDGVGRIAGTERVFIPDAILDDHNGGGGTDGGREGVGNHVVELEGFVGADDVVVGLGGLGGGFEDFEGPSASDYGVG